VRFKGLHINFVNFFLTVVVALLKLRHCLVTNEAVDMLAVLSLAIEKIHGLQGFRSSHKEVVTFLAA
jgi:hypothetical protein